ASLSAVGTVRGSDSLPIGSRISALLDHSGNPVYLTKCVVGNRSPPCGSLRVGASNVPNDEGSARVSVSPNEVLGLAVLVATLLIAYFTFRSAQAVERSAQVMERTHKASFASVLRVEFFLLCAGSREDPLYPVFSDITEEHERLQREWRNLPRDQALTRKHAIFVSVKNLGPAVATNVSLFT